MKSLLIAIILLIACTVNSNAQIPVKNNIIKTTKLATSAYSKLKAIQLAKIKSFKTSVI